ncbi:MAG: ATP-dependent zinc metalloprotease FtsH [Candidatus Dojkabacteria bacterium]|nr:ATP-dependent zinc metalloprotease FtsH [Candidatus Dojkabacteria bacterium]
MKHNSLPEDNRSRNQTRNHPDSSSTGNGGEKKRKVVVIQRIPRKGSGIGGAIASALLVVLMLYFGYLYMRSASTPEVEVSMSEIVTQIEDENVDELIVRENRLIADLKEEVDDNEIVYAYTQGNTDVFTFLQGEGITLSESGIDVSVEPVTRVNWVDVLSLVFMLLLAGGVFMFVRNMQTSGGKLLDFGQSRARLLFGKRSDVGFDDVAGIKESKEELKEIVMFLKNPRRFTRLGARIPKGVLLVGPPGSGKTLLARAVAGEAGVPFFHTSGSEFEEMLVGAGASRVRDLFKKARKAAPCIIFIDEIDAVAKKRGTTLHSGNTEQTLNQILVEMDGLEPRVNVIVMAATNRPDVLDPAILRPGRFDRNIVLMLPDVSEREQILKIHARNKKIDESVDFKRVARGMVGFSGADLENTLNEAAIIAAKAGQTLVYEKDIIEASLKVRYGPERRSRVREKEDIKMAAYHEAGHALVARYMPFSDPVHGVSIVSRGMAGGLTMFMPERDRENMTKKQMLARIAVAAGGNAAERLVFKDISTGAAADIRSASAIARDMVKRYGMSDRLGFIQYGDLDELEYLGYGYERRDYSDQTARDIDMEVKEIVNSAQKSAESILREHERELHDLSDLLLKKEVLDDKEFDAFFEARGQENNREKAVGEDKER